jgi:AcrR family transcriptional regulator
MSAPASVDRQRRLLPALAEAVSATGYREMTVAQIVARARISRNAFYEQFRDKRDCFLAAHRELAAGLRDETRDAIAAGAPDRAAHSAIAALTAHAGREPGAFALLTHEAMLAGPDGWRAREALIDSLRDAVEEAFARAGASAALPDLPARLAIGAAIRLIGLHMRREDLQLARLRAGLEAWLDIYLAPAGARKWSRLHPEAALCGHEPRVPAAAFGPRPPSKGRHNQPEHVVKRRQRERILYASAAAVRAKRDADVTVAEIVSAAGLARKVFYAHFRDKEEALLAAQTVAFEQAMGGCAGAFFRSSTAWAERVWDTGRVFADLLLAAPDMSNLGFVESYALGRAGVRRTDDSIWAFTIFLEEGRHQRPAAQDVPPLSREAIVTAAFETISHFLVAGRAAELPGLLPLVCHLVLTPFVGAEEADALIARRLGEVAAGDRSS